MMQAAEPRHGNDLRAHALCWPRSATCRSLLVQPEMRTIIVVIANVLGHEPFQMAFIEHDHMVEADRDGKNRRSVRPCHSAKGS